MEQFEAFLKGYLFAQEVLRQLHLGGDDAGDIHAETAALYARIYEVLERPRAIFGLWRTARESSAEAYIKAPRSQSNDLDSEEEKLRRAERAHFSPHEDSTAAL